MLNSPDIHNTWVPTTGLCHQRMQLLLIQVWIPLWPCCISVLLDNLRRRTRPASGTRIHTPVRSVSDSESSLLSTDHRQVTHCVEGGRGRLKHLRSAPPGCAAAYCIEPCPSACSVAAAAAAAARPLVASPSSSGATVASACLAASACIYINTMVERRRAPTVRTS